MTLLLIAGQYDYYEMEIGSCFCNLHLSGTSHSLVLDKILFGNMFETVCDLASAWSSDSPLLLLSTKTLYSGCTELLVFVCRFHECSQLCKLHLSILPGIHFPQFNNKKIELITLFPLRFFLKFIINVDTLPLKRKVGGEWAKRVIGIKEDTCDKH